MSIGMTVIPLPEAAQRLRIPLDLLTRMVNSGTLKAVMTTDGQILLPLEAVDHMAKGMAVRDKIWKKVERFESETITAYEASDSINPDLLYRCIHKGYIRAVDPPGKGGRGKTRRLNKADVLYVAELAKLGGGRGHRLFTPETIPPHMLN